MIAYGAEPPATGNHFADFGLSSRRYILYVARLEPENNGELVLNAYRHLQTDWPLVVVGGNSYKPAYLAQLQSLADERVIFSGPVYGDAYWSLQKNAGLFVFAGEIGGVHPALVEAMSAPNAVLYLDTPANRETARGCGLAFQHSIDDLLVKLRELLSCPSSIERMREEAEMVARQEYGWDPVVDKYESLFDRMKCDFSSSRNAG